MKNFLQFIFRSSSAVSVTFITGIVSFIALNQPILLSGLYGLLGGGVTYVGLKQISHYQMIRQSGLTRREYKYIEQNLKEAKRKITRLQKALWNIRSIDQVKNNFDLLRTVKKIYANTKRDPKRFYKAEQFYYKHLDSLVEITEKYAFLSSQPVKTKDIAESLKDTRITIYRLGETVKKDLYVMLDDDIDTLQFELDVAKQSIKKLSSKNDGRTL